MIKERRCARRKRLHQDVMLETKTFAPIMVKARDLSVRGMYIEFVKTPWERANSPRLGEAVVVSFYLPGDTTHTKFRLNAVVRHRDDNGLGLMFEMMEIALMQKLSLALAGLFAVLAVSASVHAMGSTEFHLDGHSFSATVCVGPWLSTMPQMSQNWVRTKRWGLKIAHTFINKFIY